MYRTRELIEEHQTTFSLSNRKQKAGSLLNDHDVMEGEKLKPPTRPAWKNLFYPPLW